MHVCVSVCMCVCVLAYISNVRSFLRVSAHLYGCVLSSTEGMTCYL